MAKIKVLHILWSASMGGIGRVVVNLCDAQIKSNLILPAILVAKSEGDLLPIIKSLGIKIIEPQFKNGKDNRNEVLDICQKSFQEYDILHFHSFNPTLANIAVKSGKKIIFTEHGNFSFGRKLTIKDFFIRYLQKKFLNNKIDFITFNSEFSKKVSMKRFGLKGVKTKVVYNGCPPSKLESINISENFKRNPKEIIITSIGRLAAVKRFDRLINAFSLYVISNSRLIIVGDGPLKTDLIEQAANKGLLEEIDFTGVKDAQSMIHVSDICVFPSQNEAFGLVAIEAYQQGKPVIVFEDGGGLPELVRQVEPELIVKSELELSNLLNEMVKDIAKFQSAEKINARISFAAQFDIKYMESELCTIYQTLFNVRD